MAVLIVRSGMQWIAVRCLGRNCFTKGHNSLHQTFLLQKYLYCAPLQRPICNVCHYHHRTVHSSAAVLAAKARNSKKKLVKPVRQNAKPLKPTFDKVITILPNMTVAEIAKAIDRDIDHVFEVLWLVKEGDQYDHENSVIGSVDILKEIVKKSGFKYQVGSKAAKVKERVNKDIVRQPPPDLADLVKRPPVVTIMGHVDHGKTTLLDSLRSSNVVAQEFGGITQHIGAFSVKLPTGESITFLDTPGHAAFSAMRERGARVTDIVVLVVAAEDGVMPQTVESIHHAQNAHVPIVVAINKIDKPEADIEQTKKMLLQHDVVLEEFGGDVQAVPISALQGTNLLELQETIVTQAELLELKGDNSGLVEGHVIESRSDPGRGKLATAVIQRGTLKKGKYVVAGTAWAKVRGMFDDKGKPVQVALPSYPVEIIGWRDHLPSAGDEILEVESEPLLKEIIAWRLEEKKTKKLEEDEKEIEEKQMEHQAVYQADLQRRREQGNMRRRIRGPKQKESVAEHEGPCLSLILKGDVDGSVEAILDTLDHYNSKICRLDLVHYGVGNITETDLEMAEAFKGEIFGFNVQASANVSKTAATKKIPIKLHKVIYKLFDDLICSLSDKLPTVTEEEIIGQANVLQVFEVTEGKKKILVAGCRCVKGMLNKKQQFRVVRNDEVLYSGPISSLKQRKNEVESIKTDVECGISVGSAGVSFQPGDIIICYSVKEVEQEIDWSPGF